MSDRIGDFTAFRQRMNERILGRAHPHGAWLEWLA